MKHGILIIVLGICWIGLQAAELQINGLNELNYTYRTAEDSLHTFFDDQFSFAAEYGDFTFGMKFIMNLPKYNKYESNFVQELDPNKLSTKWDERYVEYEKEHLFLHGGTFEETFGSGMTFRSFKDLDFDIDTRLEGMQVKVNYPKMKLKSLYGAWRSEKDNVNSANNIAYGGEVEYTLSPGISVAGNGIGMRVIEPTNIYSEQDIWGGRVSMNFTKMDGSVEAASSIKYHLDTPNRNGYGLYANSNIYMEPVNFSFAYRKYNKFDYILHDLPMVNYHNEPLTDATAGLDEEGAMGEIRYNHGEDNSIQVNYAEAWSSDQVARMNDFYGEFDQKFKTWQMTAEYSHLEKSEKEIQHWSKDLTPAMTFDFNVAGNPAHIRTEYEYIEKQNQQTTVFHYEPLLQTDYHIKQFGISIITETEIKEINEISKSRYWINGEFRTTLFENTDLLFFAGKQKGGKVCRNGSCKYVSPFNGIRLSLSTRF
jgi:hypothetical protein